MLLMPCPYKRQVSFWTTSKCAEKQWELATRAKLLRHLSVSLLKISSNGIAPVGDQPKIMERPNPQSTTADYKLVKI